MDRPNILWICSDQQRFDTLGTTGNEFISTPRLDRLAHEGTVFTHAFSQAPICTPSRASFLTGMYPSTVHACTNGNDHWDEAAPLVTKLLKDAGYNCGLTGKLHVAGAQGRVEPRPKDDGYSFFRWSHHPPDDWDEGHDYADWIRSLGKDPRAIYKDLGYFPEEIHQTTWCTNEAMRFIEEAEAARAGGENKPWLMSINYFDPHPAWDPPENYLERYDPSELPAPHYQPSDLAAQERLRGVDFQSEARPPEEFAIAEKTAAYYAMIELIDFSVGRILDFLDDQGLRENTIVIFTSDHGESLGDHGLLLKGCRFYEGLVRVPLLISGPAWMRGQRSDELVELTDLAPTLLDAASVPVPESMAGRSLVPILTGTAAQDVHRESVRAEYYHTLNGDVPGREFSGSYGTMIRTRTHKLVTYHGHETGELFDLVADPWEHENLWDDPAAAGIRFELMKRSFDQTARAVDLGPPQTTYY